MSLRLARRVEGLRRTLIREWFEAAPRDAIQLGLGQPDLPTPPEIALGGVGAIARRETGYTATAGDAKLRERVAASYPGFARGPENVIITVGSQQALFAALACLVDEGDEVLVPDPGYPAYPTTVRLLGGTPVPYPLRPEGGFRLEPQAILERLSPRTRAALFCSPSNPTGVVHGPEELRPVLEALAARGVAWLADEVYGGLVYDGEHVSAATYAPADSGIVVSGLSKDASMTGWRLGWAVGPAGVVERMVALQQHLVTCPPAPAQAAALAALEPSGQRARARLRERFAQRRTTMVEALRSIPDLSFPEPQGAFYCFVDVRAYTGSGLALGRRLLDEARVLTVPGEAFGTQGCGHLRLSFAAPREAIVQGVARLGEVLRTMRERGRRRVP